MHVHVLWMCIVLLLAFVSVTFPRAVYERSREEDERRKKKNNTRNTSECKKSLRYMNRHRYINIFDVACVSMFSRMPSISFIQFIFRSLILLWLLLLLFSSSLWTGPYVIRADVWRLVRMCARSYARFRFWVCVMYVCVCVACVSKVGADIYRNNTHSYSCVKVWNAYMTLFYAPKSHWNYFNVALLYWAWHSSSKSCVHMQYLNIIWKEYEN